MKYEQSMNGDLALFTMINQNAEKALKICKKNKKKNACNAFPFLIQ